MIEVEIKEGLKVLLYSSIKELPIFLTRKLNQYLVQEAGIGSSMEDVDEHLSKATQFLQADKKDDAIEELKNLRFNLFSMLNEVEFKTPAFLCLVHSVNGEKITDYSHDGLMRISVIFEGCSTKQIEDHFANVKKNLIPNANLISPNIMATT